MAGARTAGISGLGLTAVAGGLVVLWSGLKNVGVAETLRGFIQGKPPAGVPAATPLSKELAAAETAAQHIRVGYVPNLPGVAGAALGAAAAGAGAIGPIVTDAKKYLGVPYVWSGSSPRGMDCSGFVNYVVGHDLGLPIPGHSDGRYTGHGPVTGEWYIWSGATTVAKGDAIPGDLVCWPSHIGIYVGGGQMINAPTAGQSVKIENVWGTPAPIYRRLKAR